MPWLTKAVKKYQQKIGSTSIGGSALPKNLEDRPTISSTHVENLERSVKDLEQRYNEIVNTCRMIKVKMEKNAVKLKRLNGVDVRKAQNRESLW